MPVADLSAVPSGVDIFLDANIFIHAFCCTSQQCSLLLNRCACEELCGVTTLDVISEATHKLMLAEAFKKHLVSSPSADQLKRKRHLISSLTDYWGYISAIFSMNLLLLTSDEATARRANGIRQKHALLTTDSMIVSAMEDYAIHHLASHDADFDTIPQVTVHKPTDIST